MDQILETTIEIFQCLTLLEKEAKTKLLEFEARNKQCIKNTIQGDELTPQRNKKKIRRSSTTETTTSAESATVPTRELSISSASTQSSGVSSLSISSVQSLVSTNTESKARPIRQTQPKNYKEPILNSKLRRDIKTEPNVTISSAELTRTLSKENDCNNAVNVKKEKISEGKKIELNSKNSVENVNDSSVICIANPEANIVEIIDDEDEPMPAEPPVVPPPPIMPPPKAPVTRKARTKKIPSTEANESSVTVASSRSTRSKQSKKAVQSVPTPIKEIKLEDQQVKQATAPAIANISSESIYEDAVSARGNSNMFNAVVVLNKVKDDNGNLELLLPSATTTLAKPTILDSTYVQYPSSLPANDATFVAPFTKKIDLPQHAPTEEFDATFQVPTTAANDETVVLDKNPPEPQADRKKMPSISSIMTEDDSVHEPEIHEPEVHEQEEHDNDDGDANEEEVSSSEDEEELEIKTSKAKKTNHKELFNPCIKSPLKKKIEAFEKHANKNNNMMSPAVQRQTRTKTRARAKENAPTPTQLPRSIKPSISTPNLENQRNVKPCTPLGQIMHTTSQHSLNVKRVVTSSATKHTYLNKAASTSRLPRDSSSEDSRAANNILEEKKKKREEKLKQVHQQREAKEKEKLEKIKKAMQEKEEKMRIEAEKKRLAREHQIEEQNRKREMIELKKKELQQQAEEAQREREQAEILKSHLKQNQVIAQQQRKANNPHPMVLTFDMLNADDSTDDESKPSNKRPPPPAWSLSSNRRERIISQSNLDTRIVDAFFSVQPMTPNLREIFPNIDPKYLKRNSSAVWRTPPRYSQLPKH